MAHNQKRTVWYKEGLLGLATGVLYGSTSVAVGAYERVACVILLESRPTVAKSWLLNAKTGHPFDTIKTKMQAQAQYMGKNSMISTFVNVFKQEGIRGWYRG